MAKSGCCTRREREMGFYGLVIVLLETSVSSDVLGKNLMVNLEYYVNVNNYRIIE